MTPRTGQRVALYVVISWPLLVGCSEPPKEQAGAWVYKMDRTKAGLSCYVTGDPPREKCRVAEPGPLGWSGSYPTQEQCERIREVVVPGLTNSPKCVQVAP